MERQKKTMKTWNSINLKLIAILRGLKPEEATETVKALVKAGFQAIEIPLNSPDAFESISIALETTQNMSSKPYLIGAGTVLSVEDVEQVHLIGGNLIVSPNANIEIIKRAKELGMLCVPGVYTPSECLQVVEAGAEVLKVFPASNLGTSGFKALRAVLPPSVELCAVGGVGNEDFKAYMQVGATGFGLGSSLYKPGLSVEEVLQKAIAATDAYKRALV